MNLNKSLEYFNPENINAPIHVIGVGAVGSTLVENLVRLGIEEINIYDFDVVSDYNIDNQMFDFSHIDKPKVDCVEEMAKRINPQIKIIKHKEGCDPEEDFFEGYIFLCVDNIDVRKQIIKTNFKNKHILGIFDMRMRLTDAQQYACTWGEVGATRLLKTMNFTQKEADEFTPVSACGTTLNVVYIVRLIVGLSVANFVNFVNTGILQKLITIDATTFEIEHFKE